MTSAEQSAAPPDGATRHWWLAATADLVVVAAATWALCVVLLGGLEWKLPTGILRSRDAWRPLIVAGGGLLLHWLALTTIPAVARASQMARIVASRGLMAIIAAALVGYWHFGVLACGGLDSSGYVNAARMIGEGRLSEPQPVAALLPFEWATEASAPLGFVVGADGASRVPRFPLGLPLVMAAATQVFGPAAVYRVPFAMAAIALALVFLAARRMAGDEVTAWFATALVAVSPTMVNGAVQPMSDVPTAAWLLAAAWLAAIRGTHPVLAGTCAGMAVLTRPVVAVAALALPLVAPGTTRARGRIAATILAFLVAQAGISTALYGSPLGTGYGQAGSLFDVARAGQNLMVFARSVTVTHSPLLWVAWVVALALPRTRRWTISLSAIAIAAAVPYLFYFTWDDWEAVRFVFPGLVLVLVAGAAATGLVVYRWMPTGVAATALLGIALAAAWSSERFLRERQVFTWQHSEARYVLVGDWARTATPPDAVVLAALHSGSILHYGARETLRWDVLAPGQLSPAVQALDGHGRRVFLAIDTVSENDVFYARFAGDLRALSLVPAGTIRGVTLFEVRPLPPDDPSVSPR